MKIEKRTILVTGGASGIGLCFARALLARGNTVIICGRDRARLDAAVAANPGLVAYPCDVGDAASTAALAATLAEKHPTLDVLINNAGVNLPGDVCTPEGVANLESMLRINTIGPMLLTAQLLPLLKKNPDPAVVNVTSGLAYMPIAAMASYCATKAATHSLTLCLGRQLDGVHVVEVLPPTTETEMTRGYDLKKARPEDVVATALAGMAAGKTEIPVGESAQLRHFARLLPGTAFNTLNKAP